MLTWDEIESFVKELDNDNLNRLNEIIQNRQQERRKVVAGNFVNKLREMIFEVMHNDITFYLNNDSGGDFDGIDIEVMNDGNIIVFNFNN